MTTMGGAFFKQGKWAAVIGGLLLSASCARIGRFAEKRADHAAYGNIAAIQQMAFGEAEPFSIDTEESARIRALLEQEREGAEPELFSLGDTLAIAMANSRSYQTRKETLFLRALNLSEVHKDFNLNYNGSYRVGTAQNTFEDGTKETFGETGIGTRATAGFSRLLATGANISVGYSQNVVGYFTGDGASEDSGSLSFKVVQPLLNGFGPLVTKEPLRQAERDLLYAVRDFKRFQQDFAIDISATFYAVLRSRDQLVNARKNYESTIANREQSESYAKAGRIADFEAAQARQSELNAADRWISARADYQKSLDDFRFTLGLPIDLSIEPDAQALDELEERGLVELDITLAEALESAMSNRLDLVNQRQRVEDSIRKVEIAQRNFLPKLNASYDATHRFGLNSISNSSPAELAENLSVTLEVPFDWTEKRNRFRTAQIAMEREKRNQEESESNVQRTVRDLWRKLERNRSVYKNRLLSVELAERRVENTSLLLKQGKALTRDLLDAQDDLLSSRNEATAALVDYTINRLRFWDAIERFEIDPKGMWYEQTDDQEPVAAAQR